MASLLMCKFFVLVFIFRSLHDANYHELKQTICKHNFMEHKRIYDAGNHFQKRCVDSNKYTLNEVRPEDKQ